MATGAAGAGGAALDCPRCHQRLGVWRRGASGLAFRPAVAAIRAALCGDGWTVVRCRRCGERVRLDHRDRAA